MADVSSFFYMYAILPPEGQVYSPTHLESGLALVTCLTDRRYQKWHLGTFKARSWHDFAASIYLSTLLFWNALPWNTVWEPSCSAVRSPSQMERPASSQPATSITCQPCEWVKKSSWTFQSQQTSYGEKLRPQAWNQASHLQSLEPLCLKP